MRDIIERLNHPLYCESCFGHFVLDEEALKADAKIAAAEIGRLTQELAAMKKAKDTLS